jgi:hypothetical protein
VPTVGNTPGYSITFTPNDTANYDYSTATLSQVVVLTVNKINPPYSIPSDVTAVTIATLDEVNLPNGWTWDEPGTTPVGSVGSQVHNATFTPTDTVNYNVMPGIPISIDVTALSDKSLLQQLYDNIMTEFGVDAANRADIHEENYANEVITAFRNAEAAAKAILDNPLSVQSVVDNARAALRSAYDKLIHDHPILEHSHPTGVTTTGQTVTIRVKGYIGDVTGLEFGGTVYVLTTGSGVYEQTISNAGGTTIGAITSGSAIITLNAAFVDTLSNGTYEVILTFTDKKGTGHSIDSAVANSEVRIARGTGTGNGNANGNPINTGDPSNPLFWFLLMILSMLVAWRLSMVNMRRKRQKN